MVRLLLVLIGYGCGLLQTGYYYGKLIHVDLTKEGSGNTGATNALRVMGLKHALVIFFFDALKAWLPCFLTRLVFKGEPMEMNYMMFTALGVLLGNDFPATLKFKGGKGVSATAGWVLALDWRIFLICIAIFFIMAFAIRYVSLASMTVSVLIAAFCIIFACTGLIPVPQKCLLEFSCIPVLLSLLLICRHGGNIKRLIAGTENRFGKKKK